jgi:hypothetical protein
MTIGGHYFGLGYILYTVSQEFRLYLTPPMYLMTGMSPIDTHRPLIAADSTGKTTHWR